MNPLRRKSPLRLVPLRLIIEDRSEYEYFLNDVCKCCGEEFGDHLAKDPHPNAKDMTPCDGFAYGKPGVGTGDFS